MSDYSLLREIIPNQNQSDTFSLPNIVTNQRTQIAVITSDLGKFSPFLQVNNPSNVEVALSSDFGTSRIATFTPTVGGTFTGIVRDERGAVTGRTPYTVEVNLEPNELNNKGDADTPAVNPGTY